MRALHAGEGEGSGAGWARSNPGARRALSGVGHRDREQRLDELFERSLTNALERLVRGNDRIVAFDTGDDERRADGNANAHLGTFMAQLEGRGMGAVPLNFSQVAVVPEHTDLVVLASPTLALPPGAVQALVTYTPRAPRAEATKVP